MSERLARSVAGFFEMSILNLVADIAGGKEAEGV